jgi:hypothetical protein
MGKKIVPTRWWRRAPFLPIPDKRWIAFRMETAYGDGTAVPDVTALREVLEWNAAFGRVIRARQRAAR